MKKGKDCICINNIHPCVFDFFDNNEFKICLKFAWKKSFFSREKTFAFLKLSMISREKTFAFCCFEISKGINFREKGPKTRKTRKFLPAKVSALKVIRFAICEVRIGNSFPVLCIAEKQQFRSILDHSITVYNSISTLAYMQGDLNRFTGKKTATGKNYQQPISRGQFYTLLSHAKSCNRFFLLNFESEDIKVNQSTLEEMI